MSICCHLSLIRTVPFVPVLVQEKLISPSRHDSKGIEFVPAEQACHERRGLLNHDHANPDCLEVYGLDDRVFRSLNVDRKQIDLVDAVYRKELRELRHRQKVALNLQAVALGKAARSPERGYLVVRRMS